MSETSEDLIKSKERVKDLGEVFTPLILVDEMLNDFNPEDWTNPNLTWLEPSCGSGNFLVAVMDRLMVGLTEWEPDPVKRHTHIIENQLYGVDIMQDNVDACIERLRAHGLNHHIRRADGLAYEYDFEQPISIGDGLTIKAESAEKIAARNAYLSNQKGPDPTIVDIFS